MFVAVFCNQNICMNRTKIQQAFKSIQNQSFKQKQIPSHFIQQFISVLLSLSLSNKMIQRTRLPNIVQKHIKKANQKHLSTSTHQDLSLHNYQSEKIYSQIRIKTDTLNEINQSSLKTNNDIFKPQSYSSNKMKKLAKKMFDNPQVFHSNMRNHLEQQEFENVSPYFYKVHHSLNILENDQQLKQKHQQLIKSFDQTNFSNKKAQKKIRSLNQINIRSQSKQIKNLKVKQKKQYIQNNQNNRNNIRTQPIQVQNLYDNLENRKQQLTKNALQAKYSFKHFNSGQIFNQIAVINENKILNNLKKGSYRITDYGAYRNDTNQKQKTKQKNNEQGKSKQQNFKEQYNSFLKQKLPPSFGENGNKECIYQQYVQKKQKENLQKIKSKLIQGHFLPTQPHQKENAEFIFSNSINLICQKNKDLQNIYIKQIQKNHHLTLQKKPIQFIHNTSTVGTSKIPTQKNTKLNTMRQGQSLLQKIKLNKLARLQMKQKAKMQQSDNSINKKGKKIKILNKNSQKIQSALSNYKNVKQDEIQGFILKTNTILGESEENNKSKNMLQLSLVERKQNENSQNKSLNQKILEQFEDKKRKEQVKMRDQLLNKHEMKHLQNVDKLLGKWTSNLRKGKEDLDSLPWRLALKVQKQKLIQ